MNDKGAIGIDEQHELKWKGNWNNTWEPEDNLTGSKDLLRRFHAAQGRDISDTIIMGPTNTAASDESDEEQPPQKRHKRNTPPPKTSSGNV